MKARISTFAFLLSSILICVAQLNDEELRQEQIRIADSIEKFSVSRIRLFLYSIIPEGTAQLKPFHGYSSRGSVEIISLEEKGELLKTFIKGIREGDVGMKCFRPRHALRIIDGSSTTDFLICFECRYVQSENFPNGGYILISPSPEATFNMYVDKYFLRPRRKIYWSIALLTAVVTITTWFYRKKILSLLEK